MKILNKTLLLDKITKLMNFVNFEKNPSDRLNLLIQNNDGDQETIKIKTCS